MALGESTALNRSLFYLFFLFLSCSESVLEMSVRQKLHISVNLWPLLMELVKQITVITEKANI